MKRFLLGFPSLCLCVWTVAFCLRSQAFQSTGPVLIVPRQVPENLAKRPAAQLRLDTSLVLIPVHVSTPAGTPVTDLKRDNFRISEDDREQPITYFAKDDVPVSVGLVFDSSGSMRDKVHKAAEAASAFFQTANAEDEFFLIEFDDRPRIVVPFTHDSGELYKQILRTRPFGRTTLLDAVHLALAQMKSARHPRKALVILSDGGDNRSRYTATQIKNAMIESDVQIYAMGLFSDESTRKRSREEVNGPKLLDDLARETGGLEYPVDQIGDLPAIGARIGTELRNEYLVGYAPANRLRDGKYRRVKLDLEIPGEPAQLRVQYRQGYYAPTE